MSKRINVKARIAKAMRSAELNPNKLIRYYKGIRIMRLEDVYTVYDDKSHTLLSTNDFELARQRYKQAIYDKYPTIPVHMFDVGKRI